MTITRQPRLLSPVDQHLTNLGWSRLKFSGPVYQLVQGSSAARLEAIAVLGSGTRYRLDASSIALPFASQHLAAHAELTGPVKFVEEAVGGIVCVADLPAAVLVATSEFDVATTDSSAALWAECLTSLATGDSFAAGETSTPTEITKSLEAAGYTASIDGSGVKATLVLPGRFAEVAIEPDQPCGLKLSLALTQSDGQSPEVSAAARSLAQELNRRLLLVRVSEPELGGLTAEVRLTMSRVHEAWLLAAMQSLAAAAGLALRPLAALQDPALAARLMGLNGKGVM